MAAVALIALAGCEGLFKRIPPEPKVEVSATQLSSLPGWADDDPSGALAAFRDSCAALSKRDPNGTWALGPLTGTNADWIAVCREAAAATDAHAFFERNFAALILSDRGNESGLITGYFEPELRGARTRTARFNWPLYRRPPDLVTADLGLFRDDLKGRSVTGRIEGNRFVPYPARAIIEQGALAGKKLEILWVDDPIESFFLHIQGSGRVVLETGETIRVGYDSQNGHVYRAIGRDLIERGALTKDNVSLQTIAEWLKSNPGEAQDLMNKNPSYIFFRELTGRGPLGAQGVPLTPGRSLAVDRKIHVYGMPIWLETTYPSGHPLAGQPLRRLMVAQDTGGAITGIVRGDFFWGAGAEARAAAGTMKQPGRFVVLVPRSALKISWNDIPPRFF